jgi:hypothetical protein
LFEQLLKVEAPPLSTPKVYGSHFMLLLKLGVILQALVLNFMHLVPETFCEFSHARNSFRCSSNSDWIEISNGMSYKDQITLRSEQHNAAIKSINVNGCRLLDHRKLYTTF